MSINKVIATGYLTRDPELRQTQSGMAVLSFGIAINDRRKNPQTGDWEDYANFVDCTLFGKRAESLSNSLTKGMKIAIEGKLRYSSWERDGRKRNKLEVVIDDIGFMSKAEKKPQQEELQGMNDSYQPTEGMYGSDIPF